jgi:hypothetical protein
MDSAAFARQIGADAREPARERWLQRAGWLLFAVPLLLAGSGLLGEGGLSRRTTAAADGTLQAEWDAVARYQAPTQIVLTLPAGGLQDVWVERRFLDAVEIEAIEPAPVRERAGAARRTFTFETGGAGTVRIALYIKHREPFGLHRFLLGRGGGAELQLQQTVLP